MNHKLCLLAALAGMMTLTQLPSAAQANDPRVQRKETEFVNDYVTATRIILSEGNIDNKDYLLKPYVGQVSTTERQVTNFKSTAGKKASILLDFGKEMQGGIQIIRAMSADQHTARFRVCFGESVSEALSNVDEPGCTATNEHSARDVEVSVPWLGASEYGNTGFRFVRIDLLDEDKDIPVAAIRAISRYRDIPYLGQFKCSDARLNEIWQTGAYTVQLNMQDYLWDGIKRDRLVWIGDMHPEVMTVNRVFGNHKVVQKSLDYVRDGTKPTDWMNGICSYSLWWIIIQHHLYWYYGDMDYLEQQHDYLRDLLHSVMKNIDGSKESYQNGRFIDWPSNDKPDVIHAGLQAITVRALEAGAEMAGWLGDAALQKECATVAKKMHKYTPDAVGNSQAAALLSLQGFMKPEKASEIILANGADSFSSFMGYYMLEALAKSGNYVEAMDLIDEYWGKMLDLGATTFWENFNYVNSKNAGRIDEIVPEGKFDIHADGGAYCYVGLRHSFCHGWASGPTTWLSDHVLGIKPVDVGFSKIRLEPHLGNLEWAEGSFPTPHGVIRVSHKKEANGRIVSTIQLPKGVELVK